MSLLENKLGIALTPSFPPCKYSGSMGNAPVGILRLRTRILSAVASDRQDSLTPHLYDTLKTFEVPKILAASPIVRHSLAPVCRSPIAEFRHEP